MNQLILIPLSLIFVGCAGTQIAKDYERNTDKITVNFEEKVFEIWDDEIKSSALVIEIDNLATTVVKGAIWDWLSPVSMFEGAMDNYLDTYKDGDCEIDKSVYIYDGAGFDIGYEIFYKCDD